MLVVSSFIFLIPLIMGAISKQFDTVLAASALISTSFVYHSLGNDANVMRVVDTVLAQFIVVTWTIRSRAGFHETGSPYYGQAFVGGVACASVYLLNSFTCNYNVVHVIVQQLGAFAWISYLIGSTAPTPTMLR